MPTPSTTVHPITTIRDDAPEHRHGWLDALRQRDRLWLLLIILMFAAFFLGGCHARSGSSHVSSCGSDTADGVMAAFYLFYVLGWVIVAASGG